MKINSTIAYLRTSLIYLLSKTWILVINLSFSMYIKKGLYEKAISFFIVTSFFLITTTITIIYDCIIPLQYNSKVPQPLADMLLSLISPDKIQYILITYFSCQIIYAFNLAISKKQSVRKKHLIRVFKGNTKAVGIFMENALSTCLQILFGMSLSFFILLNKLKNSNDIFGGYTYEQAVYYMIYFFISYLLLMVFPLIFSYFEKVLSQPKNKITNI